MAEISTGGWSIYKVKYRIFHISPVVNKQTAYIIGVEVDDVVSDLNEYFKRSVEEDKDFSFGKIDSIKLIAQDDIFITKKAAKTGLEDAPAHRP